MDGPGGTGVVLSALVGTHLVAARCAAVDLADHRIPNRSVVAIGMLATAAAASLARVPEVALGAAAAGVPLWLVRYGNGVGLGDVKFAAALGAVAGLLDPVVGLLAIGVAAASSALYGRLWRRQQVALAPWLWWGFTVATLIALANGGRTPWLS